MDGQNEAGVSWDAALAGYETARADADAAALSLSKFTARERRDWRVGGEDPDSEIHRLLDRAEAAAAAMEAAKLVLIEVSPPTPEAGRIKAAILNRDEAESGVSILPMRARTGSDAG